MSGVEEWKEHVWQRLGRSPLRRAMLGRERCDAIVAVTAGQMERTQVDYLQAGNAGYVRDVCRLVERRVKSVYQENCGMAFTTLILIWAISAIVQILVLRWMNSQAAGGES